MKHNEFSLFLKILCFVPKGSLTIPDYRCLLIGRVQNLYTIEHRFQSISVTLLSLLMPLLWYFGKSLFSCRCCRYIVFEIIIFKELNKHLFSGFPESYMFSSWELISGIPGFYSSPIFCFLNVFLCFTNNLTPTQLPKISKILNFRLGFILL